MSRFKHNLDHVRVAAPCNVDWETMFGDERVRFCGQCQLNVYNLSEMSRTEAERLISQTEGRLCVRYYLRKDGSVISRNCPVGLAAIKRRLSRVATAIGSTVLSFFAGIGVFEFTRPSEASDYRVMGMIAIGENFPTSPPASKVTIVDISLPAPMSVPITGRLVPIERPQSRRRRNHR